MDPAAVKAIKDIPLYAIHGQMDEVFPVKKLEEASQKLKARGFQMQLKVVDGLAHYQTSAFVVPLQESVSWIRQVWNGVAAP